MYKRQLLYYDITSRQSIQSILEAQPLQMRHLQKLFSGLRTISEVMEKYLLSPEDLLLLPEFVYMDMATGEYSFIYYPERMGEENTDVYKRQAYATVSKEDTSGSVMENTQTVYAGLTYGKNQLMESLGNEGSLRGLRV